MCLSYTSTEENDGNGGKSVVNAEIEIAESPNAITPDAVAEATSRKRSLDISVPPPPKKTKMSASPIDEYS